MKKLLFISAILTIVFAGGCIKEKKNINTATEPTTGTSDEKVYDFSWQSPAYRKYLLPFKANVPEGSHMLWMFDGDKYEHVYSDKNRNYGLYRFNESGQKTVTLVVDGDTANKITKQVNVIDKTTYFYTGSPTVGDTFHFSCDYPDAKEFLWTFGDGSTSKLAAPTHVYTKVGEYETKLWVNDDHYAATIEPKIKILLDPKYTKQITTNRLWDVYLYPSGGSNTHTTNVSYAIDYVDKVTIFVNMPSPHSLTAKYMYDEQASKGNIVVYGSLDAYGKINSSLSYVNYDFVEDTVYVTASYDYSRSGSTNKWRSVARSK